MTAGQLTAGHAVSAGGIVMAYLIGGPRDGPPMIMLHALGERGSDWGPVANRFAAKFRVIAPDLRGHGDSDRPGAYDLRLMRDDVLAMMDALGLHAATFVGHSMGAGVAYLIAMHRTERVTRLVIEDAAVPYPRDRPVPARPAGIDTDFDWDVVPAIVGQVNAGDPAAWEGLAAITAPTLLIGGGPSSHIPHEKLADVAALIPRCDLITIPAGHNIHRSMPDAFIAAVLEWLGP